MDLRAPADDPNHCATDPIQNMLSTMYQQRSKSSRLQLHQSVKPMLSAQPPKEILRQVIQAHQSRPLLTTRVLWRRVFWPAQ